MRNNKMVSIAVLSITLITSACAQPSDAENNRGKEYLDNLDEIKNVNIFACALITAAFKINGPGMVNFEISSQNETDKEGKETSEVKIIYNIKINGKLVTTFPIESLKNINNECNFKAKLIQQDLKTNLLLAYCALAFNFSKADDENEKRNVSNFKDAQLNPKWAEWLGFKYYEKNTVNMCYTGKKEKPVKWVRDYPFNYVENIENTKRRTALIIYNKSGEVHNTWNGYISISGTQTKLDSKAFCQYPMYFLIASSTTDIIKEFNTIKLEIECPGQDVPQCTK